MYRVFFVALAVLAACTPALNWRTVEAAEGALQLVLPCKPDRASRPVPWGTASVEMAMLGCEAQGALFAVSHFTLDAPAQAGETLTQWQTMMRAQWGLPALPALPSDAASTLFPGARPFVPAGALNVPQALQTPPLDMRLPSGQAGQVQAVWLARMQGTQMQLVHAVVIAPRLTPEMAQPFFEGIALR